MAECLILIAIGDATYLTITNNWHDEVSMSLTAMPIERNYQRLF